jgi:tungstate transport system substrate-binding protein
MNLKLGFIWLYFITLFPISVVYADTTKTLHLATTTSVENSGLLDYLMPEFKKDFPNELRVTVVGSGKALRLGRTGKVDVVWVHSPSAEKKFVDEGFGVNHKTVMRNDFVIAGPVNDPAQLSAEKNVFTAFKKLSDSGMPFLSRGDDSGTHKKELGLWEMAGIDPVGEEWYFESGMGMGASLAKAQKKNTYIMIDRATFVVRHDQTSHKILVEDAADLSNPYSVIAVNPVKHPHVNFKASNEFIEWLMSSRGKQTMSAFTHNNQQLYFPVD